MESDKNYIYGRNAVLEAIASETEIEKIFIAHGTHGPQVDKIFAFAKKSKINITVMDKNKFRKLAEEVCGSEAKSQGVLALVQQATILTVDELIAEALSKSDKPVIVALDGITDPHNLGAIARTIECSGGAGLFFPFKNSASITPTAVKTSAGALEHLPVARVNSLIQTLLKFKDAGFWIVGTDIDGKNQYTDKIYDSPVVLIIGSEGSGMSEAVKKHCDYLVQIPMHGNIQSLNASVSAGVLLFEIARQKSK